MDMTIAGWWVVDPTERALTVRKQEARMLFGRIVGALSSEHDKRMAGRMDAARVAKLERTRERARARFIRRTTALEAHIARHGSIIDNGAVRTVTPPSAALGQLPLPLVAA